MGALLNLVERRKTTIIQFLIFNGMYTGFDQKTLLKRPLRELEQDFNEFLGNQNAGI